MHPVDALQYHAPLGPLIPSPRTNKGLFRVRRYMEQQVFRSLSTLRSRATASARSDRLASDSGRKEPDFHVEVEGQRRISTRRIQVVRFVKLKKVCDSFLNSIY
jgi:hypothetical protein